MYTRRRGEDALGLALKVAGVPSLYVVAVYASLVAILYFFPCDGLSSP